MSYKEQPCIHNDGLHIWYMTGKTKMELPGNMAGESVTHKMYLYKIEESKCDNCGDTRWK